MAGFSLERWPRCQRVIENRSQAYPRGRTRQCRRMVKDILYKECPQHRAQRIKWEATHGSPKDKA